jgi:hypothetical protein
MTVETKVCRQCEQHRPITTFQPLGKGNGERRGICRICKRKTAPLPASTAPKPTPKFKRALKAKRYLITSAQNNTAVHGPFFKTLQVAAERLGAELVVIPLRYRNPTSQREHERDKNELFWAKEVEPYLCNERKRLGPNLVFVGDVKTQPTASSPLTGFESLTGAESCILGHPKMQLRVVPVPSGRYPKILTTTGSCTERNYSDTKAGKVGEFHHYLGAIVVELRGKQFFLRQVNADRIDGSFIDLDKKFTTEGVEPAPPALGLVIGDTHVRVTDPKNDRALFGPGGIVETLNPQTLVFHDLVDGDTTNPHQVGNPFLSGARALGGMSNVHDELAEAVNFVNERAQGRKAVIVDSNHHDFLARWVLREDWKRMDPKNALFYLETAKAMLESARMTPAGATYMDPFGYWVRKAGLGDHIRVLHAGESFKLGDVECGLHGHRGPNGARGSTKNLSRMGTKVVKAHDHTPGIEEGGMSVGTSSFLHLPYTEGSPSSWLHAHCPIYGNGKRALLFCIGNRWRA